MTELKAAAICMALVREGRRQKSQVGRLGQRYLPLENSVTSLLCTLISMKEKQEMTKKKTSVSSPRSVDKKHPVRAGCYKYSYQHEMGMIKSDSSLGSHSTNP